MYRPYRRATQWLTLAFMFGIPVLNLYEIYAITGTFYAINIGGLGIADPVVILQSIFAVGQITVALATAALFPVFLALLFGRVWCGWLCPYHVVSDATQWLRRTLRERILKRPPEEGLVVAGSWHANVSRFGFLILGTVLAGAVGIPVLNYVNAPAVLSTEAMIFVKERAVSLEVGFIAALVLTELVIAPRFWCRLFCPTGSFISLFRTSFTLRVTTAVRSPKVPCCKQNQCSSVCPMGLAPFREGNDLLCTNCGRCIDACREGRGEGRLRFSGFQAPVER